MKMKEFGPPGGHASLRSATVDFISNGIVKMKIKFLYCGQLAVADLRGALPHYGQKFSQFHAFFGKLGKFICPMENPESAPGL